MDEITITLTCTDRTIRALAFAVSHTLEKWTGQGDADQEMLMALKTHLQGCVLEFVYHQD